MMDAPKRIWAHITSGKRKSVISFDYPSLEYPIEYVRKDIHDAAVSKARVDALKEAADVCITEKDKRNEQRRKYPDAGREQLQRWMAGSLQCQFNADTILALIEKEPKP